MERFYKVVIWFDNYINNIGRIKCIAHIEGDIVPDESKITYDGLVEVYKKLGFEIKGGQCYKNIDLIRDLSN